MKKNVLIIGYGNVGKFYESILKKNHKINTFIFDNKIRNNKINFTSFVDVQKNINRFSHVIICTPSNLHFKYAEFFLKNKINVLIEKPFVLKIQHAQKLIKLKNKDLKCWTVLQNRYNKSVINLKKILSKKKLKAFFVNVQLMWNRSKEYYNSSWRGNYKSDGGVLMNQAIHTLDLVVYLFGEIISLDAMGLFNKKKLNAEDFVNLILKTKNSTICSFAATTRADLNYHGEIDIYDEKKRITLDGISFNYFNIWKKNKKIRIKDKSENFLGKNPIFKAMGNGHKKILSEFLNDNIKKSKYDLEINKNLHVLKIIHTVYNVINKKNNQKLIFKKFKKLG